jgi:putative spermidine/putrescine transport system substrate-binding protein
MRHWISAIGFAAVLGALPAQAQTTVNVATAGDQNMVDYVKDYLAPMFEKANPGVKVVAVGTGPGDSGSQKIFEKLEAQKKAATRRWQDKWSVKVCCPLTRTKSKPARW